MNDHVSVPREPTKEMLDAARDWSRSKYGKPIGNDDATGCYKTMLAAAPVEPKPEAKPADEQMKRDAERYRWLRDPKRLEAASDELHDPVPGALYIGVAESWAWGFAEEEADAAIDIAMKAGRGES